MVKVSVLMSVHNGERFLCEAVDSILGQTFSNFEFIIIDDASTDGTAKILDRYTDPRIIRRANKINLGLTRSLNMGLKLARGLYIARQDDDDVSLPDRLATLVSVLDKDPDAILATGNTEIIDAEGKTIARSRRDCDPDIIGWYLMFHNHLASHSQVVFRAETARRLGGYDEEMTYSQDHELWQRMSETGKLVIVSQTLIKNRVHDECLSKTKTEAQERLSLQVSIRAIQRHARQKLDIKTMRRLRHFWSGNFRALEDPLEIHGLLSRIVVSMGHVQGGGRRRQAVARQFLKWAGKLSLRREFPARLRLTGYAFRWAPTAAMRHWLWDVWAVRVGQEDDLREGAAF